MPQKRLKKSREILKNINVPIELENIVGTKIFKKYIRDVLIYNQDKINENSKISHENNEFVLFQDVNFYYESCRCQRK